MKTTLILLAVALAGVSYFELRAQNAPSPASGTTLAYPYNQECILTLDPRSERRESTSTQSSPAGFLSDSTYRGELTLRGQLIYMSAEWCVLKDGTFENWVPREKVLSLRVSK